jgi:hypothetical protein
MSQDPEIGEFEKRTRALLEDSASRLDGRTQSRLTRARHAALDRLERPRAGWRMWVPAGAAAAVALIAVLMWRPETRMVPTTAQVESPAEDLELLSDAEAPDFADAGEDLEFYEWAAGEMET